MVVSRPSDLKAKAFTLKKLLSGYKVKLSHQQCLEVVSRLETSLPYDALLASPNAGPPERRVAVPFLRHWFRISQDFCDFVSTLDPTHLTGAWYPGDSSKEGLQYDGKTFLLAQGAAVSAFAESVATMLHSAPLAQEHSLLEGLTFSVEHGDVTPSGIIAVLRIKNDVAGPTPLSCTLSWKDAEAPLLYGAEARAFITATEDPSNRRHEGGRYHLNPGVHFTYDVCSRPTLRTFRQVLRSPGFERFWAQCPAMDVETYIEQGTEEIEERFSTRDPGAAERLAQFCDRAGKSRRIEEENWPPYLRLVRFLDSSNVDDDLLEAFRVFCIHASTLRGESGAWAEIFGGLAATRVSRTRPED